MGVLRTAGHPPTHSCCPHAGQRTIDIGYNVVKHSILLAGFSSTETDAAQLCRDGTRRCAQRGRRADPAELRVPPARLVRAPHEAGHGVCRVRAGRTRLVLGRLGWPARLAAGVWPAVAARWRHQLGNTVCPPA